MAKKKTPKKKPAKKKASPKKQTARTKKKTAKRTTKKKAAEKATEEVAVDDPAREQPEEASADSVSENGVVSTESSEVKSKLARFHKWVVSVLSNPWFGGIAGTASIAGVVLAIYAIATGRPTPDAVYLVHPIKSVVYKSGNTSAFQMKYRDENISSDVTAIQVFIWNAGTGAVKAEHVLSPPTSCKK